MSSLELGESDLNLIQTRLKNYAVPFPSSSVFPLLALSFLPCTRQQISHNTKIKAKKQHTELRRNRGMQRMYWTALLQLKSITTESDIGRATRNPLPILSSINQIPTSGRSTFLSPILVHCATVSKTWSD